MSHLEALEKQLYNLDEQLRELLPTPPVGTLVQWFQRGTIAAENARAAIVTAVEEPGRVKLTILPPAGMPIHKQGVFHASHPIHQQKGNSSTVNNGAWDYRPDDRQNRNSSHWNMHRDKLTQRKETVEKEIASHLESVERKKQLAEREEMVDAR